MNDEKLDREPLLGDLKEDAEVASPVLEQVAKPKRSKLRRLIRFIIFPLFTFLLVKHALSFLFGVRMSHGCARDKSSFAWVMEAFEPKKPGVPFGRLAENFFLTIPNSASAISASRQYASVPHLAGSDGDLQTAEDFLLLLQREFGIPKGAKQPIYPAGSAASRNATLSITNLTEPTAWIDVYYPVLNTPLDHSLQILDDEGEVVWTAELEEVADQTDGDAWNYSDAVPTWHGLSRDGEVTGKLIDANYGLKSDYDALVAKGVNLTGAIIIARYGGNFRGLKIKAAQELGAAGVLIYSDPRDDGTVTEANGYTAYPHGPARNPTSVQRGSVQFLSIYPGDPTTPGYPAYENITRTNGSNIPEIPSLPISWANAKVLLEELNDKNRTVKLVNHVDTKVTPIWNSVGVIPGHIKDEVIIVGNHRDAWVLGATDPTSGTASVHEVVRGFGALLKEGWKPLRTIVIASWDAEEYGLIGSTEWGEDFADWIQKYVVAYFNLDSSVSGSKFSASASPSLAHFIRETAEQLPHPTDPTRTLWDARQDQGELFGQHDDAESLAMEAETTVVPDSIGVSPLGSGSDFTVFLQRLGVASLSSGFGSTRHDPVYHYHSVFDSERWQEVYGDVGFVKHVAVAKHLGVQTLRLADSIILPFNTTHYAFELESYLNKVEDLADASSVAANLTPLRAAIKSLQFASLKLDHEKHVLDHLVRRLVHRWRKHFPTPPNHEIPHPPPPHHPERPQPPKATHRPEPPHHPKRPEHPKAPHHPEHPDPPSRVGRVLKKCKGMFGPPPPRPDAFMETPTGKKHRVGHAGAWHAEQREKDDAVLATILGEEVDEKKPHFPHLPHHPHWPHWPRPKPRHPSRRMLRAFKAVRKVNQKLVAFERGFIHEDGIKDREWYRHLGVAPGKWLGYGATTLPALTEAITIEKNATLVEYEATRLKEAIEKLTAVLRA